MKLLWISDAACHSGFAKVTHSVLDRLRDDWDVHVIGINATGDPPMGDHSSFCTCPECGQQHYHFSIYPAAPGQFQSGSIDVYGAKRVEGITRRIEPDVILALNDPWVVPDYVEKVKKFNVPVVGYIPIDGENLMTRVADRLNSLTAAVFYTEFGERVARQAGFNRVSTVIPHGFDSKVFHPVNRQEARRKLSLPLTDEFVFGNVNRNQPRKYLPLTMQAFHDFLETGRDAYLYIHAANKDMGHDLKQLSEWYGIADRFIIPDNQMSAWSGIDEHYMKYVYSTMDVQVSTTGGEGWGLTQHEGAACRIPQIVPDYSALADWLGDAAYLVPTSSEEQVNLFVNTIHRIPDRKKLVEAMIELYDNEELRKDYADRAYQRATEDCFSWDTVAAQFDDVLSQVVWQTKPVLQGAIAC